MLMLSAFTSIYEILIGPNTLNPEYREGVFSSVGLISVMTTLIICAVFYLVLGRWRPVFHKASHWIIALSVNAVIGFCLAYVFTNKEIGAIDGYAYRFAFINTFYTAVYFGIFSLLLKRLSIFAKHSPL